MVAQVYPIKRLPRRFGFFDYAIPDGLELRRGDFVSVPFRGQPIAGVVAGVVSQGETGRGLKSVERSLPEIQSLTDGEIKFFETLAFDLAQSVPAVLHAAWPGLAPEAARRESAPGSLTLRPEDAAALPALIRTLTGQGPWFIQAPDLRRMAAVVAGYRREHPQEAVVVLLPNVRDAAMVAKHLAIFHPWLISGQEKPRDRAAVLAAFRREENDLLIGTRLAALASHPKIGAIFVLRSSHANHKQSDRNPRYDSRSVAKLKARTFGSRLVFMDALPRAEETQVNTGAGLSLGALPWLTIADMKQERMVAEHPIIGPSLRLAMDTCLADGEPVLLAYNRKGVARRLRCADCQFAFPCPKCTGQLTIYEERVLCPRCGLTRAIPLKCPKCAGANLQHKGWGNRSVIKVLQKLWPQAKVALLEKGASPPEAADIILATNHYLENIFDPFVPPKLGLVAMLDADLPLYHGHYRALEYTLHDLEQWRGIASAAAADFLAQTDHAELLRAYAADPTKVQNDELASRLAFDQPPGRRVSRISNKTLAVDKATIALSNIAEQAKTRIPEIMTVGPFSDDRGQQQLELAGRPEHQDALLAFLRELDDSFVVDTDAI